jgi:hypothetical protein
MGGKGGTERQPLVRLKKADADEGGPEAGSPKQDVKGCRRYAKFFAKIYCRIAPSMAPENLRTLKNN